MGNNGLRYHVLCVPLRRNEILNKGELEHKQFHQYNYRTGFFDQFLDAWAAYCDGTKEDALNMILYYMAKQYPQSYVQHSEMASSFAAKEESYVPPTDFVSYDGTYDVKWNTRYGELIEVC